MSEPTEQERTVLQYIHNAGGNPMKEWLVDDFEPLGERLLDRCVRAGWAEALEGPNGPRVFLTSSGHAVLGTSSDDYDWCD